MYLLVVSTSGRNGVAQLPIFTANGSGWTLLASTIAAVPGFAVYLGTSTSLAPSLQLNNANDKWAAQIYGFTYGTTAAASTIASSATGTLTSVAGFAGQPATAGYVLVGASTLGALGTNWVAQAPYTTVVDLANSPDIFLAVSSNVGTSNPAVANQVYGATSGSAHAVQIVIN